MALKKEAKKARRPSKISICARNPSRLGYERASTFKDLFLFDFVKPIHLQTNISRNPLLDLQGKQNTNPNQYIQDTR